MQDAIHICTKLKTRFTKPSVILPMGKKNVSVLHVHSLIDNFSKDQHQLSPSYLDSKFLKMLYLSSSLNRLINCFFLDVDKMNFKAIDKLCAFSVIELMQQIPESEATRQFLIICRFIVEAFLNKSVGVNERIYDIWYTIFFLRLWRQWLAENGYSINQNFITSNAYTCIELNGYGILLLLEKCRKYNTPNLFLPWLYSSQPCESNFRQTRSMTSTYSTVVNFSMNEMIKRLNRIQALNDFNTDFRKFKTYM